MNARPPAVQRVPVVRRPPGAGWARAGECADPARRAAVAVLRRRQLRAGLATSAAVAGVLAGLPLLASGVSAAGPWLLLGAGIQLGWILLAVAQLRRAERIER